MSHERQHVTRSQAEAPFFAGIDLGGTNIKLGLVDSRGQSLAYLSVPTLVPQGPEEGARRMGEAVLEVIRQAGLAPSDVPRVGLVTPGTMDIPAGMLLEPHNLPGWFHFPIRDRVGFHCGLPVVYSNDANAAAYGEFWCGAATDYSSMIFLTLGTGVGGGIIIGDLAIVGEHSAGAECGHIVIDCSPTARMCACGRKGHLEAYASATAVIARTKEALAAGRASSLTKRTAAGDSITPLVLLEEAERGDALAIEIILETAWYLGVGVATMLHVIDPIGVILGGAMTFGEQASPIGRQFVAQVKETAASLSLTPIAENLSVEFASLGGDAGYIGAAGLARLEFLQSRAK